MSYLAAIVVVGLVIAIHECGHLLAANDAEFRRLPVHKTILFALGGPFANVVAAYVCLVVLGSLQLELSVIDAVIFAMKRLWLDGQLMAAAVVMLFAGTGEISGIVGIIAIGGSQFGSTLAGLLAFSVAINLNLALFNLLPLLPLDGGRIAFAALEKIYRPFARIHAPVTMAGWAFMLALMVYATVQDVGRIV